MDKSNRLTAEEWDTRYKEKNIPWHREETDSPLREYLHSYLPPQQKILEIGPGLGVEAAYMAEKFCHHVTAIDISPQAIQDAIKKQGQTPLLDFKVLDFLHKEKNYLDEKAPFDAIFDRTCFHTFNSHQSRLNFAKRASQLLKDDGLWISYSGNSDSVIEYQYPQDFPLPPMLSFQEIFSSVQQYFFLLEAKRCPFIIKRGNLEKEFLAFATVWKKKKKKVPDVYPQ